MAEKKKTLTHKDRIFVKELMKNGGNQTDAALAAYEGIGKTIQKKDLHPAKLRQKMRSSAAATAVRKLKDPNIQSEIARLMDEVGLTDKSLIQQLRVGVNSRTVNKPMDHHTKLRYVETALKLRGHFDDKAQDSNQTVNFLQMFIEGGEVKDINPDEFEILEDSDGDSVGGEDSAVPPVQAE